MVGIFLVLGAACGRVGYGSPEGFDSGASNDASRLDASPFDGRSDGSAMDAGGTDSSIIDGNFEQDADRIEDAGVVDAGPSDGGTIDAGIVDAGRDAGFVDAGRDAGFVDAGRDAGFDGGRDAGPVGSLDAGARGSGIVRVRHTPGVCEATATFLERAATCVRSIHGACEVLSCEFDASPAQLSAGQLQVRGTRALDMGSGIGGTYQVSNCSGLWDPAVGGFLELQASGAAVPAFTMSTVAPTRSTQTAPSSTVQIPRGDIVVRWTGGGGEIAAIAGAVTTRLISMDCRAPASAGTLTVPATALELLRNGLATDVTLLDRGEQSAFAGADYRVTFRADVEFGRFSVAP